LSLRAQNIAVQNFRKENDYSDAPDEFRGKNQNYLIYTKCQEEFLSNLIVL
jgi:hypothetical protein